MKISQYLGKRCWLILFALIFGFSSLSISYANFDFQGDEGANSLTGRGDKDDDRGDYGRHKDKKHHGHHYNDRDDCDFDDGDDLGACSDKKLSKGHITLCKESNCPEIGIVEVCKKSKHLDKFLAKGYFLQTEFVEDNDGDGLYLEGSEVVACESPGDNFIVKEGAEVDCDDSIASGSSCVAGQNQCGDDLIGENQCVDGAIACTNVADIPEPMVEVFLYANNDGDSASVNNGSEQRLDCNEDGQPDSGLGPNEGLEPLSVEDCDDTNADAQEGVLGEVEACDDGVDNNCNGQVDENCEPIEVSCPCNVAGLITARVEFGQNICTSETNSVFFFGTLNGPNSIAISTFNPDTNTVTGDVFAQTSTTPASCRGYTTSGFVNINTLTDSELESCYNVIKDEAALNNVPDCDDLAPVCGDSVVDPGEECDDGNTNNGDECSADCTVACQPGETYDGSSCIASSTCPCWTEQTLLAQLNNVAEPCASDPTYVEASGFKLSGYRVIRRFYNSGAYFQGYDANIGTSPTNYCRLFLFNCIAGVPDPRGVVSELTIDNLTQAQLDDCAAARNSVYNNFDPNAYP